MALKLRVVFSGLPGASIFNLMVPAALLMEIRLKIGTWKANPTIMHGKEYPMPRLEGEGTVVRGNSFELTIGRPTLKGGREPIDSGAITSDTGFWTREISNNKIVLNGLGLGILIYRPPTWAKIIVIDNNTVEGSTTMSLDLSDFLTNNAVSQIIVSRNWFINSNCDDLLDTEAVRIRDLGEASVKFTSNLIWRTAVGKYLHPAIGIKNVKASIEIVRNTIYDTGKGIVLNGTVYGEILIQNNIVIGIKRANFGL